MRIIVPKEIDELYEVIMPYMVYTEETGWELSPDAPQKAIDALRRIDKFWEEAKRDAM